MNPTIGIVLAAGLGARLHPLTQVFAKPVIPFLNRPLLYYALDSLANAGLRRIGVNAYHLGEQVRTAVEKWREERQGAQISVSVHQESLLMGTGGGSRGVYEAMGSPRATAVVMNGDMVSEFSLRQLLEEHQVKGSLASLLVAREGEGRVWIQPESQRVVGLPSEQGSVRIDCGDGREVSFCGVSLLEPEVFSWLPRGPGCLLRSGLARRLAEESRVGAIFSNGVHLDVGTPERYRRALTIMMDRFAERMTMDLAEGYAIPPSVEIEGPVLLSGRVSFEGACHLGPYLVVGGDVVFAEGSRAAYSAIRDTRVSGTWEHRLRLGQLELSLD